MGLLKEYDEALIKQGLRFQKIIKKLGYGYLSPEYCESLVLTLWDYEEIYYRDFVVLEYTSRKQVKKKAKNLKDDLREFIPEMKQAHCYEIISQMMELKSWNVLSGLLKKIEDIENESPYL